MAAENTFEYTARVDERAPDDYREWPEPFRKASDFSIAKLLADHPGTKVASETSSCIDETDSRFPDGDEHKGKFWVIRSVELEPKSDSAPEIAPLSAAARLRAFEDAHFGKTAVRLHGRIERGFGSPFKAMLPEKHQNYAALEKLVTTEQALSDARGALLAAEAAHEAAGADAAKFGD